MNAIRGRKGFQRKAAMADEAHDCGPTAQTLAKLQSDVLLDLVESGKLSVDQERAGREINATWEELERLLGGGGAKSMGGTGGGRRELADVMSHALARNLRSRQQPWASREIEKTLAPGITRYGIVWRVCNLNWSIAVTGANTGLTAETVLQALRDSLDVYSEISRRDS